MSATLRIDVADRCAGLELSRRLARFRSYLVQNGRERWYVAVRPAGSPDAVTAEVLGELQAWIEDGANGCVLHHGGRAYPLRAPAAF